MSIDSKCDLKVPPPGLNDGLDYGVWGKEKKLKNDAKDFGNNNHRW